MESGACGMGPCGRMSQFTACILVRGTIYYLMSRKNSKYYPGVHRYYSLITEMSNHVTDWGNIPSDVAFTDRFNTEFAIEEHIGVEPTLAIIDNLRVTTRSP